MKEDREKANARAKKWYWENHEARRTYIKAYHKNNRSLINKQTKRHRNKRKKELIALCGGICADCKKEYHHSVYDFHHLNPKEKDISIGFLLNRKMEIILKELEKCVMLCANCHRLRHFKEEDV